MWETITCNCGTSSPDVRCRRSDRANRTIRRQIEVFSKLKKVVNFRAKTLISIAQNRELGGKCPDERSEKKTISVRLERCPMGIYQTAVTTSGRNRATTSGSAGN